jgi:cytidine deaminase
MPLKVIKLMNLTDQDRELVAHAEVAQRNGYAPYSRFLVGSAVRTATGEIFAGANFENAVYGLSICAEVTALTTANTAGFQNINAIAIVGHSLDNGTVNTPDLYTTPCGRCRQLISESSQQSGGNIKIIAVSQDKKSALLTTIDELLPNAFGFSNIGLANTVMRKIGSVR